MVKPPVEIAKAYCDISVAKTSLSNQQLFLLGFLAGAYAAMSGFLYYVTTQDLFLFLGVGASRFFGAALFITALVLILFAGSELFTGNCLIAMGLLAKRVTLRAVLRNWVWVYFSNLAGAVTIGYLIYQTGLVSQQVGVNALQTAVAKVNIPYGQLFLRAIFCNWLVCLAVWMSVAADDAVGKIALMWFPIMMFVTCGYEHCIVNMYYLSFGIFIKGGSPEIVTAAGIDPTQLARLDWFGYWFRNMIPVTIGNMIGAIVFVSVFYFLIYRKQIRSNPS